MMKVLFYLSLASLLYFSSCVSYSSFQTAKTQEKGEFAITGGLGYNQRGEETFGDLAMRLGVKDSLDIGLKVNTTTFGSTLVMVDVKKQMQNKLPGFESAMGFGISPIFDDEEGIAFHIPAYFSLHSSNELLSIYTNPRIFYYIDYDKGDGFNNSTLGFGNSFGFKFGRRFSVMPEWSFFLGRFQNKIEVNEFLSVGLGWNVN